MGRKLERIELNETIHIHDCINGGHFGELVNLTTEGMMLISDRDIEPGSIFQLSFTLPAELLGSDQIELGADCLWCRAIDDSHRFWAGFQIIDASAQAIEQLEALIELYSK